MDTSKYLEIFLDEAEEHIQELNSNLLKLEKNPGDETAFKDLSRHAHTLKGIAAAMGYKKMSELSHVLEDKFGLLKAKTFDTGLVDLLLSCFDALSTMLNNIKKNNEEDFDTTNLLEKLKIDSTVQSALPKKVKKEERASVKVESFVKVKVSRLDALLELVGELLTNRMRVQELSKQHNLHFMQDSLNQLDRLISDTQYQVMQARLIPLENIFNRFPRLVRDLSTQQNKNVDFVIEGGDIELDRSIIDKLSDPLVHLLRNSVDHGIETPEDRKRKGKSEKGTIKLIGKKETNFVKILIEDDGAGFDIDAILKAAISKGLVSEKDKLSDSAIMELPFLPEFSTAKKVTEVSGRGVGLDVVKSQIEKMNGIVRLDSTKDKTTVTIELPFTLAIIQCFLIKAGGEVYGIPMNNVLRTIDLDNDKVKTIEKSETFILDDEDIPLVRLVNLFGGVENFSDSTTVVIVERAGEKAGLAVDSIIGSKEVIIKPLSSALKNTKGFSGATILGDGSVALLLDIKTMF